MVLTSVVHALRMLSVHIGCEFIWAAEVPTAAVVQVEPRLDRSPVVVRDAWTTTPPMTSRTYWDHYANRCRRLVLPAEKVTLRYEALVHTEDHVDMADHRAPELAPGDLPDEALVFTLPSRYCQSDLVADDAWRLFGSVPAGYDRVQQICDFVNGHLTWTAGATTSVHSALEVYDSKTGVCRDFAHLAISLCRALNIPARYAFGYLPDVGVPATDAPMDFCAWMEVYLGGGWYTFDPRNNARRAGRVLVGVGRDALDVAMFTTFGGPELVNMDVWAEGGPPGAS